MFWSLLRPKPPHSPKWRPKRVISPAQMPRNDAIVMTATSRCAMCAISCARTLSSSTGSSRRSSPVVTQTTEFFWLRPVANAFGTSVSAIATFGFGVSDMAQMRSTTPCSSGASCRETMRPFMANSVIRSEKKYCASRNRPATTSATTAHSGTKTKNAPTKTTYTSPNRNIVTSMRDVSPLSEA